MTEQEARELLDEHRAIRPRKRVGLLLYELRPDGRLDVYRLTKSRKRAIFEHTSDDAVHPDVRAWHASRR